MSASGRAGSFTPLPVEKKFRLAGIGSSIRLGYALAARLAIRAKIPSLMYDLGWLPAGPFLQTIPGNRMKSAPSLGIFESPIFGYPIKV